MASLYAAAAKYIGVPFLEKGRDPKGWDCWGCLRFVMSAEMGIHLPSYAEAYRSTRNRGDVAEALIAHLGDWEKVERAAAGHAALFEIGGRPLHVGLIVSRTHMLHVFSEASGGTVIEDFTTLPWSAHYRGAYRLKG